MIRWREVIHLFLFLSYFHLFIYLSLSSYLLFIPFFVIYRTVNLNYLHRYYFDLFIISFNSSSWSFYPNLSSYPISFPFSYDRTHTWQLAKSWWQQWRISSHLPQQERTKPPHKLYLFSLPPSFLSLFLLLPLTFHIFYHSNCSNIYCSSFFFLFLFYLYPLPFYN